MNKSLEALKRLSALASMYCDECATNEEDLDRGMFEKDYQAVKTIEKDLKDYQEIKEIAKHYKWEDVTNEIFNVKTDKKYRDLFDSAIVNIQEDYRKARALEIILNFSFYNLPFLEYLLSEEKITQEEYDLLREVLNNNGQG